MAQNSKLQGILDSLGQLTGQDFFNQLALALNKAAEADYLYIAEFDQEQGLARTLSLVAGEALLENFEYQLKHSPCASVAHDTLCIHPADVCQEYPQDLLLNEMKVQGYVGVPWYEPSGKVSGLLVALFEQPTERADEVAQLLAAFSGRVSAEMNLAQQQQILNDKNCALEDQLAQRTLELAEAEENLKATQQQVIEHEKMASLGQMVAGVTHDVNTPIGVAILGVSTSQELVKDLKQCVASGKLTKTKLESSLEALHEADETLEFNLKRAAELVKNFKQVAVDYDSDERMPMFLNQWLTTLLTSLRPMMKKYGVILELDLPEEEHRVVSCPSKLSQLLTNLLSNAAIHGFAEAQEQADKKVEICLSCHDGEVELSVTDNGAGMDEETQERILEPYYTTRRGKGGTGLGMSIVHNIVTEQLKGEIHIDSTLGQGSKVKVRFPIEVEQAS